MNIFEPLLAVTSMLGYKVTYLMISVHKSFWSILLGTFPASAYNGSSLPVDRFEEHVDELLDEFRVRRGGLELGDAAREVFRLLGEIPILVGWNRGLGEAHHDLILATVYQAERFGNNTGPLKRRFAIDLITRVLRRYNNQDGLPFIAPIEDAFVKPFLGIIVDWCVALLNLHDAWPPVRHVTIPRLFYGRYGRILKLGLILLRAWVWLRELFFFPSKYERQLRNATRNLQPEVDALLRVLPPTRVHVLIDRLASIVARVGQLTAPHLTTIDSVLRLSNELEDLTPEERREAAFHILRRLLRRAYVGNPFALDFIDSIFGEFLLREMIRSTEWVLARNGLLPHLTSARN